MNKVRKLAEGLVEKHPSLFKADFDSNKKAIEQIMVIRNRALRNQIAGAITVIMKEQSPGLAVEETALEAEASAEQPEGNESAITSKILSEPSESGKEEDKAVSP